MNFNNYYNKILEQYNTKNIPFDVYTTQVLLYSSNGYPTVIKEKDSLVGDVADEYDIDWVINTWQESSYPVDILGDTSVEVVSKDAQPIRDAINEYFGESYHGKGSEHDLPAELHKALNELESRVKPNPVGYYKFFGNSEHYDYWVCYVYVPPTKLGLAKDATKEDADDINNW
jgi:hypothetical protein